MKTPIIPVFLPMQGCPGTCVFCDQNRLSGSGSLSDLKIQQEVLTRVNNMSGNDGFELAFYGGTFTGLPSGRIQNWLSWAGTLSGLKKIRISTRPDYINEDILRILQKYGVRTIELGIQSFQDTVLSATGRGYDSSTAIKACKSVKAAGFSLGIQLMPGLPSESRDDFHKTVSLALEQAPDMVRIYPTVVLKNTKLAEMVAHHLYTPLTLEQAVEISAQAVIRFRDRRIRVIRIGLRTLKNPSEILAGPYHPQFKYMVESRIILKNIISSLEGRSMKNLTINVHPLILNYLHGFRKTNLQSIRTAGYPDPVIRSDAKISMECLLINGESFPLEGIDKA